jgi:t-SNARE complex subunit (syntaxin)
MDTDAYASRASKADKRSTLYSLAVARRRGLIDTPEYRLRRQLARRAETVADLQALLEDLADLTSERELTPGRDHWRYGRWRGPVREGRELEIQRFVGALLLILAIVVVIAVVYLVVALVSAWR